jgi:DNA-binding NtrC family response regulator
VVGRLDDSTATLAPRVLIVEDEARMRELLLRAVGDLGLHVGAARSAEQATKMLEDVPPWTILLLDLNLPGIEGLEFLSTARTLRPYLQAIILTGFGGLAAAQRAIRLDVVDFLTKPFALHDLEASLARAQQHLRGSSSHHPGAPEHVENVGAEGEEPPPTLAEVERDHILAALARHNGNRAAAARDLGISERTLYYRLGQYHVSRND